MQKNGNKLVGYNRFLSRRLVNDKFLVISMGTNGYQSCPFDNCTGRGSLDYSIINIQNNISMKFSDLTIHLIRDHEFFEGSVEYRVDPISAIRCLDLSPGIDYSPKYQHHIDKIWRFRSSSNYDIPSIQDYHKLNDFHDIFYKIDQDTLSIICNKNFEVDEMIGGYKLKEELSTGHLVYIRFIHEWDEIIVD